MHSHTRGSDGIGTPEQIVKYALEAGLDGLCLTDHHSTHNTDNLKVAKALREAGLLVIHGCEYSTAEGHLLIYGVNYDDLQMGYYPPMQDVIDEVNARGGVCVPAHPYKGYRRRLEDGVKKLRGVRAYEVANGQCEFQCPEKNKLARKAAEEKRKLGTGGSDAHNPKHIGLTYTEFQGNIVCELDFLNALKRGQFRAVVSRNRMKHELKRRRGFFSKAERARGFRESPMSGFSKAERARWVMPLDRAEEDRQVTGDAPRSDPRKR